MKCRICGAELTKPGDICNNCLNELLEDKKNIVNDNRKYNDEVLYVLKRKFKIWFQCGFYFESLIILIIMFIASIQISVVPLFMILLSIMLIGFFISIFFKQKKIESAKYTFYGTKLIYEYKFFRKEAKTIKYKDIKEITYSQTFWERCFNLGKIQIDTNSGNFLNNGIEIECVENVEDVFRKLKEIINK